VNHLLDVILLEHPEILRCVAQLHGEGVLVDAHALDAFAVAQDDRYAGEFLRDVRRRIHNGFANVFRRAARADARQLRTIDAAFRADAMAPCTAAALVNLTSSARITRDRRGMRAAP